jgi:CDP-diacylglycerol--glycerol-3-phosphate 3-phosphatidyltransferase
MGVLTQNCVERFYLLAPAVFLSATFVFAFVIYCGLCAIGHPPKVSGVKHNQLFGKFFASFLVWMLGPAERLLLGRVSPNVVTAISLLMCGLTGLAAGLGHLPGAVWLYTFAGILDVLDGRLARLAGTQNAAGALFDSVSDRWGELFAFAGYAWFLHDSPWLLAVIGAIGGSMMVSYTRARAEGLGIDLAGGVMQRAERIALVAGGTLIAACFFYDDPETASAILGVTMLLTALSSTATAVHRWIVAYRELARRVAAPTVASLALGEPAEASGPVAADPSTVRPFRDVRPIELH